jgi:hypothetical protein
MFVALRTIPGILKLSGRQDNPNGTGAVANTEKVADDKQRD